MIILLFVCGAIFLIKAYNTPDQRIIYVSYALVMIMYGFTRIFFIFADYYQALYWGQDSEPYFFWTTLGYSIGTASIIPILYVLEKFMNVPTNGLATLISVIIFSFALIAVFGIIPKQISQLVIYAGLLVIVFFALALYIYVIKTTEGSVRQKAIGVFIGLLILIIGMTLDTQAAEMFTPGGGLPNQIRLLIASFSMDIGVIIFTLYQLRD